MELVNSKNNYGYSNDVSLRWSWLIFGVFRLGRALVGVFTNKICLIVWEESPCWCFHQQVIV